MNPKNKARNQPMDEWCGLSQADLYADAKHNAKAERAYNRSIKQTAIRRAIVKVFWRITPDDLPF